MNVDVILPKSEPFLRDAPKNVRLDLSRIEKEFNITDYVGIDQGLKNTIEWVKNLE